MARHLGPLELVGDRWVIGDAERGDGLCVVLTPQGLEHRGREQAAPLRMIEWSELSELTVRAAYRRWQATRAAGFLAYVRPGIDVGHDGCSLRGILRPGYEPHSIRYTHHEHRYSGGHVIVLKALFKLLSNEKKLERLGDPAWLDAVVAQLSSYTSWYAPRGDRLVKETVRSLGA